MTRRDSYSPPHQDYVSRRMREHQQKRRNPIRRWMILTFASFVALSLVGLLGIAAFLHPYRQKAEEFDLREIDKLEVATILNDRHGNEIGRLFLQNRQPVSIDQIPSAIFNALTAVEDSRFFRHSGVDYMGIMRATLRNLRKSGVRAHGASTLTQQLARNVFLDASDGSLDRKFVEIFLAQRIEREYSANHRGKSGILEAYLNRVYFGSGYHGIQAASMGYFGKNISDVTIEEAAMLCGLLRNPSGYSPYRFPEACIERRNHVLDRMLAEKMISQTEWAELKIKPLNVLPRRNEGRNYANEAIRAEVAELIGEQEAQIGGFTVFTTFDAKLQEEADKAINRRLKEVEDRQGYPHETYSQFRQQMADFEAARRRNGPEVPQPTPNYLQGAVLVIDNATGGVLAMAGGRNFLDSMYNRAIQGSRPIGTTFTPFVFSAAYSKEGNLFPGSQTEDSPLDNRRVMIGDVQGILGEWGTETDHNIYDASRRLITLKTALSKGKNAASARVAEMVGMEKIKAQAEASGFSGFKPITASYLGQFESRLDEAVLAFSSFANAGTRPKGLHYITRILDQNQKVIYTRNVTPNDFTQSMDAITAWQVHSSLKQSFLDGSAAEGIEKLGMRSFNGAGKTGVSYDFRDTWFVGYNKKITCGVWVGFDRQKRIFDGAYSSLTAMPIWADMMKKALPEYETPEITPPTSAEPMELCIRSGKRSTDNCYEKVEGQDLSGQPRFVRTTYVEYVRPGFTFNEFCDMHGGGSLTHVSHASTFLAPTNPGEGGLIDSNAVKVVYPKTPGVIGEDPYGALAAIPKAEAVPDDEDPDKAADSENPDENIIEAEVVPTDELGDPDSKVKIAPPPPFVFEP